jgi:ABC-type uncharacterized transport system substrate-binding protein
MRRRELITFLGGAAAAWPLAARAQQLAMPVVGFLHTGSAASNGGDAANFQRGLRETGYIEGQNVAIEYRWAEGLRDRLPALAADLVRRHVSVIVAPGGDVTALSAKAATMTIPIVFMNGSDPVASGLVASINRPGGNVTGVSLFASTVDAKRLDVLHELVPQVTVAVLNNALVAETDARSRALADAAKAMGLQLQFFNVTTMATLILPSRRSPIRKSVHCLLAVVRFSLAYAINSFHWLPDRSSPRFTLGASLPRQAA